MLLNIPEHVLHVVVRIARVIVVVRAAPVAVGSCWEFHVHYWVLVREILGLLAIVFWGAVTGLVQHQIPIGKAIIMHV